MARAAATSSTNRETRSTERRPPVEPLERVEQVAGAELRPEQRERLGPRDGVEAQVVAEPEHGTALARLQHERRLELAQPLAVRDERVAVRRRRRADTHARLLRPHLVPHLALGDAASERLRGLRLRLHAPQVAVRDVVAAAERGAGPPPAALLDAGDGDRQLRARLDEHGHVEDAVLLRTDELLAVVEQHPRVGGVVHDELGHRAGVRGLVDPEAARERLVEGDVLRDRVAAWEERGDDDPAVLHGLAELEGLDVAWRSPFVLLESAARAHVLTGRAAS